MSTLEVTQDAAAPARLDALILAAARAQGGALPRARLREMFRDESIRLAGRPASAAYVLPPGTHLIELRDWQPLPARARPADTRLPIAYEDADLLVIDKPSGVASLPHDPEDTTTAVSSALAHHPAIAEVGRAGLEPGLLHRLDTGTSGLLAFAKTPEAWTQLHAEWGRSVRKTYRALLSARPREEPPFTIDVPLGRDARSAKRMLALPPGSRAEIRGRSLPAETRLLTIEPRSETLLDATLEISSGVMHQIRCHLAWIGAPIVGDPVYGGAPSERLWLHAWRLELSLPGRAALAIEAPLPSGWADKKTS